MQFLVHFLGSHARTRNAASWLTSNGPCGALAGECGLAKADAPGLSKTANMPLRGSLCARSLSTHSPVREASADMVGVVL
eukprot:scaffold5454_cov112-Isochrysis_galbana.AAC.1